MAAWSAPTLEGRIVRLEPLRPEHEDALWEASRDPRTWRWLSVVQPRTREEWHGFVGDAIAAASAGKEIPLVTLWHERVVGSTRFLALRPEHGSVEIGWTWLDPSAWGTGVNVEAKFLQMQQAFDVWRCRRVEWKTDAQNERSCKALEALGATFEGIHRNHMLVRGGENRDSAWFSVTDAEWPDVRARLDARLAEKLTQKAHSRCPVSPRGTGAETMIETVRIVGARGRVGAALSARLAERGVDLDAAEPDVVVLCVPDRAIGDVAAETPVGPWVAHVSGATPLAALDPHVRRFGLHPLQSFSTTRGPEQLDGVWAAITAESGAAREIGHHLAELLGLRPFDLEDSSRAAYHAGAAIASNYLVTLRAAARSLLEAAGAPPEALDPLIQGVVDTGYELTGPIARGDWETVERHLAAIRADRPELEELYVTLAAATARVAGRDPSEVPA